MCWLFHRGMRWPVNNCLALTAVNAKGGKSECLLIDRAQGGLTVTDCLDRKTLHEGPCPRVFPDVQARLSRQQIGDALVVDLQIAARQSELPLHAIGLRHVLELSGSKPRETNEASLLAMDVSEAMPVRTVLACDSRRRNSSSKILGMRPRCAAVQWTHAAPHNCMWDSAVMAAGRAQALTCWLSRPEAPVMVKVLPAPVWPYASTEALNPRSTLSTMGTPAAARRGEFET